MVLNINNQKLTNPDFLSGKFSENNFSKEQFEVIKLAKEWLSGQKNFTIHTSGSTGKPKKITLTREILEYSARATMEVLDPENIFKTALLCINPEYIGGKMVVIRSLIHDLELTVVKPSSDPFSGLEKQTFDLVSMVPLQVQTILNQSPNKLLRIHSLLIGGAPLEPSYLHQLRQIDVNGYHTYGMTETASHIALDHLSSEARYFTTLGDVAIDQDQRSCLKIKGTITGHKWVQTNDVVQIITEKSFEWLGRVDFVINSGGYKVHPEKVESALTGQLDQPFMVGHLNHPELGAQVVLIIEGKQLERHLNFSNLHPYERPKKTFFVPKLEYTSSGKIDRKATLNSITS